MSVFRGRKRPPRKFIFAHHHITLSHTLLHTPAFLATNMSDPRFAALRTDPRYRLPSRKESRTAVDPRFKRLFTDQDFRKKAKVDRYGRKIQAETGKKELEKLYRLDNDEKKDKTNRVVGSDESNDDEGAGIDVEELVEKKDLAREGFSESDSEEESMSEEEDSDDEAELAEETAGQEQTEDIPMGEVSQRVAAVNMDWDNIRAMDIMAVASSFAPAEGRIESVTIYPSEFGRERLQREELEGPPREIFASSKRIQSEDGSDSESDEDDDKKIERKLQQEQVNEGEEFDTAKLRQYQLERLRYYYAVITCSSKSTAKALYDSMDGREYLTTSNFFDLRFIPDSTSFEDDTPGDECHELPTGYKPNEFRTEALTHSKVKLTWDQDDTQRKEVQKRAFSRAEIDENDLQAYVGSESSDAESVASRKSAAEDRKQKNKEAQRTKMRAAFGLADEPAKSKSKKSGEKDEAISDMQITFTSGVSGKEAKSVFENEPLDEESTRDRYIRKEKERNKKRKEKMKAARGGERAQGDLEQVEGARGGVDEEGEDLGFDDPFFTDPAIATANEKRAKKAERQKKRDMQAAQGEEAASRRAELELLMAEDQADNVRHFDMREIEKAEKEARRKGKSKTSKKKSKEEDVVQDGFQVDSQDPRFKALFDSHEYAIDPTNPRFKSTKGMKSLLEEGRKKRKVDDLDEDDAEPRRNSSNKNKRAVEELDGLVKRLKGDNQSQRM